MRAGPQNYPTDAIDINKLTGSEQVEHKFVECRGDPSEFPSIVQRTIAFVKTYSDTVGRGDLAGAYALTDSSLRARMTQKLFEERHREAAGKFRGPALEYRIERFVYVLANDAARQDPKDKGWEKDIPRGRRRSRVIGFWIRNRENCSGCRGRLWITEEDGDYRVADFDFYGE